jgi:hypothetical protein
MVVGDVVNIRIIGNEHLVFVVSYREEAQNYFVRYDFLCCNCRQESIVVLDDESFFVESVDYGYFASKNDLEGSFLHLVSCHPAACLVVSPTVSSPSSIVEATFRRPAMTGLQKLEQELARQRVTAKRAVRLRTQGVVKENIRMIRYD